MHSVSSKRNEVTRWKNGSYCLVTTSTYAMLQAKDRKLSVLLHVCAINLLTKTYYCQVHNTRRVQLYGLIKLWFVSRGSWNFDFVASRASKTMLLWCSTEGINRVEKGISCLYNRLQEDIFSLFLSLALFCQVSRWTELWARNRARLDAAN